MSYTREGGQRQNRTRRLAISHLDKRPQVVAIKTGAQEGAGEALVIPQPSAPRRCFGSLKFGEGAPYVLVALVELSCYFFDFFGRLREER